MPPPVTTSYDDGEDLPTPEEDLGPQARQVIQAIRAIDDPKIRRAVFMLFVLAVLHGRIGR
jgi:hypothetical protein